MYYSQVCAHSSVVMKTELSLLTKCTGYMESLLYIKLMNLNK